MIRATSSLALLAGLAATALAQNPCEGSGTPAYLTTTPAIAGGQLVMNLGSPLSPNGIGLLLFGNDAGPAVLPFCLDTSTFFTSLIAVFDAAGNAEFDLGVAAGAYPTTLFAKGLVFEDPTWNLTKTVRVSAELADSHTEAGSMAEVRSLHTATAIEADPRDNRTGVLVIGGATGSLLAPTSLATTERFDALTRTWSPGPTMSTARSRHAVVKTLTGDILVTGGMTNAPPATGGPATGQCELYVVASDAFVPFATMNEGRMGHAITQLPDGRIFVSGGLADWTNAGPQFVAMLNTARATTEIYDPGTGLWSAGPTMASQRVGHTHTVLDDGRILITAGVSGGQVVPVPPFSSTQVPTHTPSCEIFDPATNTLSPAASIGVGRGFHTASRLPSGEVLVIGGTASLGSSGEAIATNACLLYDPVGDVWNPTGSLPTAVAFHSQVEIGSGDVLIVGGFLGNFANLTGSDQVARHDGVTATALAPLATHPVLTQTTLAVGTTAAARMHDSTVLIAGGFESFFFGPISTARSMIPAKHRVSGRWRCCFRTATCSRI